MSELEFQSQVLTELRGINQRLGHLEVEVDSLKTEVGSLKTEVGFLKTEVGALKAEVGQVKADLSLSTQRMDKWEERFFQLSRDNLIIARTVIVAAASVVIFGSLLQNADAIIGAITKLLDRA